MLPSMIIENIRREDGKFANNSKVEKYTTPKYSPRGHYLDLCKSSYYNALLVLRHFVKFSSDYYFGVKQNAVNVDLFMLTSSISSPMGPGSDSEPVPIKFGSLDTYLVDSSQFGFEPLLLNDFDKVYCYLPSMRGEDPDDRHLNQFYHCELEMVGQLDELFPVVEGYIKILAEMILLMGNIVSKISEDPNRTNRALNNIVDVKKFPSITFEHAVNLLVKNGKKHLVNFTKNGRDIGAQGEIELLKILNVETPVWMTSFDRDRVPFYQKPDPNNTEKTINADLLFPPIIEDSFGGEILGAGQRQDSVEEILESLKRQNDISPSLYGWYIDLRRNPKYQSSSGFGLGIERFIAWSLGKTNIRDCIIYPRIKNVVTFP